MHRTRPQGSRPWPRATTATTTTAGIRAQVVPISRAARRAAAVAVLVPALAACASGGGAPGGSAGSGAGLREQAAPVWREAAQCIRDHGYPDFPDPVVSDDGTVQLPDDVERALTEQHQDAASACEPILGRLPAAVIERAQGGGRATPELIAERKRFARCMREHGEPDWPDPDADGGFTLPTTPGFGKRPGSSAALAECRKLLRDPNGDLGVH